MVSEHLIAVSLGDQFSPFNCEKILKKGDALGMVYLNTDIYKRKFLNTLLTIDEANHAIMAKTEWDVHALDAKLFDNFSTLIFTVSPSLENFILHLNTRDSDWKKEFYVFDGSAVIDTYLFADNARYARLLLDLVENFHIINFDMTEVDYKHLTYLDKSCFIISIVNKDTSYERIIRNIYFNKSCVIQSPEKKETALSDNDAVKYVASQFSLNSGVNLYIVSGRTVSRLIIFLNTIILYPLDPINKKMVNHQPIVDLAFYIKLLLGICEGYAILEFKTTF